MEEFDLFNQAINEYNQMNKKTVNCSEDCTHSKTRDEKDGITCENLWRDSVKID